MSRSATCEGWPLRPPANTWPTGDDAVRASSRASSKASCATRVMTAAATGLPGRTTFQRIHVCSAMTASARTEQKTSGYIAQPPWRMSSRTLCDSSINTPRCDLLWTARRAALDPDVNVLIRALRLHLDIDVAGRPVVHDRRGHAGFGCGALHLCDELVRTGCQRHVGGEMAGRVHVERARHLAGRGVAHAHQIDLA